MFNVKYIHRTDGYLVKIVKEVKIDNSIAYHLERMSKEAGEDSFLEAIFPEQDFYNSFRFYSFLQPEEMTTQTQEEAETVVKDVNEDILQLIDSGYKFKSFFGDTINGLSVNFSKNLS